MSVSRRLTIFEGPDGAGKTTLARAYATHTGAHYVHLGPFPHVDSGLARLYAEAMSPAVLGLSDVVLDRSWLSEKPYGNAFRGGHDRLESRRRQLERLALRCATCVVRCLPPLDVVESGFALRRRKEYLSCVEQLRQVYEAYVNLKTSLPVITLNPLIGRVETCVAWVREHALTHETTPHDLAWRTAGNLGGRALVVGQDLDETWETDPLLRWPFGGLSYRGAGLWLAERLDSAGRIDEADLCWADAGAVPDGLAGRFNRVFLLGLTVGSVSGLDASVVRIEHPQMWKRFHATPYPLIDMLKETLCTR